MQKREQRLTELSITDELTGLYNKRWFLSKIDSEMDHARRMKRPLSLILPGKDKDDASVTAQRLRRNTQSMRILLEHEKSVQVTVSLGVAQMRNSEDPETLFERADAALYQAKEEGRNRVVTTP